MIQWLCTDLTDSCWLTPTELQMSGPFTSRKAILFTLHVALCLMTETKLGWMNRKNIKNKNGRFQMPIGWILTCYFSTTHTHTYTQTHTAAEFSNRNATEYWRNDGADVWNTIQPVTARNIPEIGDPVFVACSPCTLCLGQPGVGSPCTVVSLRQGR